MDSVYLYIEGALVNRWGGDAIDPTTSSISFNYMFAASGSYAVELRMTTIAGCDVSEFRTIDILPHYTNFNSSNPYDQNFDGVNGDPFDLASATGGWNIETRSLDGKSDDLITTWAWGGNLPGSNNTSAGAVYSAYNTVPNPDENREISFVYSPSFDISGFNSPTISISRYSGFISFRDGAVLQYSEDDGRTWENVGSYNALLEDEGLASTPGWYDREAITAAPGTQAPGNEIGQNNEGIGWAIQKGDDESDWRLGISPLGVNNSSFVRFRFALAGQAGDKEDAEGFGFDDFKIYDRDQIVVLELFSSTLVNRSIAFTDSVENNPNFNGSDILTINYFTDFANGVNGLDKLNRRNSRDPGAKSSFYGIADVPSMAISGDPFLVNNLNDQIGELEARLNNAKLEEPVFDIDVVASVDSDNYLNVNATFTANSDLHANAEIALFVAVVEPTITLDEAYGRYPAGTQLHNVLRKILPNAAGRYRTGPISRNDTLRLVNQRWLINNMFTPESFRVVVYAQDLNAGQNSNAKKIYQATSAMVTGGRTILSAADELADVSVYPNPADKQVTLEFANPLSEKTEWVVYDQAGREVVKGALDRWTKVLTIQTADMPSGLYFIHLYGEERKRQTKRVLVVH